MMQRRDEFVKNALSDFLKSHSAEESISAIDDIVLSYLVSILEELGSTTASDDLFDVDQFTEMMEAYLPGFQAFNSIEVSEWMFELASKLDSHNGSQTNGGDFAFDSFSLLRSATSDPLRPSTSDMPSEFGLSRSAPVGAECGQVEPCDRRRADSVSNEGSACSTVSLDLDAAYDGGMMVLVEMFPALSMSELSYCLELADGDLEHGVQWVLHRQELGQELKDNRPQRPSRSGSCEVAPSLDDNELKKTIVAKYSYVDTDEDKKLHRPTMPKPEPKKLVRYLDNQVVNVKGERYTELKKTESEEVKKTYVHLKAAKQYRFH